MKDCWKKEIELVDCGEKTKELLLLLEDLLETDTSYLSFLINNMLTGKPLTALDNNENDWECYCSNPKENTTTLTYGHKRYIGLCKYVEPDGSTMYMDVNAYDAVDINAGLIGWNGGQVGYIHNELFPVTFPYKVPEKKVTYYCENLLVDPENGDYDTVWVAFCIDSNDIKIEINRYFGEVDSWFVPISKREYLRRKKKANRRV